MVNKNQGEVNNFILYYESLSSTKLEILTLPFWMLTPVPWEMKQPDYTV